MEMVKVDPQLFVTCRLCLKDQGIYQITPAVKNQIKYCFDIDVEPFDGLPQLICASCEKILSDYYQTKRIFVGTQNALKAKLEVRKEIAEASAQQQYQQDTVSSSQQTENVKNEASYSSKAKKRKTRTISNSSASTSDADRTRPLSPVVKRKPHKKRDKSPPAPWKDNYNKRYACRLCDKHTTNKGSMMNHIKKHADVISIYSEILNHNLSVNVIKLDDKPNITDNPKAVMLSHKKILVNKENNENFSLVYVLKDEISNQAKSDKSDSDDFFVKNKSNKRRQLVSTSSTDTVFLEDDNKLTVTSDIETEAKNVETQNKRQNIQVECINIADSSDSNDSTSLKASIKVKIADYKAIQDLVTNYQHKYLQRHESLKSDLKNMSLKDLSSIKHKILNMGRKVINKPGINSTGLLRYMECSSLDIKWIPSKDLNFVRIMPLDKPKDEVGKQGWRNMTDTPAKTNNDVKEANNSATVPVIPQRDGSYSSTSVISKFPKNAGSKINEPCNAKNESVCSLSKCMEFDKKLLNASPVANPKQLPKKSNTFDTKVHVNKCPNGQFADADLSAGVFATEVYPAEVCPAAVDLAEAVGSETCMPIITSTTSLAVPTPEKNETFSVDTEATSSTGNNVELEKPVPRIKVKPVSELMSERVLKSLGQQQNEVSTVSWNPNVNFSPANRIMMPVAKVVSEATNCMSAVGMPAQNSRGFVTLNTVELPNTKTDSPFRYLKNLLQMHDIVLLGHNEPLPSNLTCLVKFKVQFSGSDQNVTLCLSVHCGANCFFLGLNYVTSADNLDINTFPANWQWEILKIYTNRQDVIKKMLQNAQKVSQDVFIYTQRFLCVLKSIEFEAV